MNFGILRVVRFRIFFPLDTLGISARINHHDKLKKALFQSSYILAALLIGSQFYESWWRDEALQAQICSCDQKEVKFTETEVQVILLRYSMHLIPGIGAGIWICTPKVNIFKSQ